MSNQDETDEQAKWRLARDFLKAVILSGEVPIEPTEMKPKQVWNKYRTASVDAIAWIDYGDKPTREKFTRMVRALRKKHKDGDLQNDGKKQVIVWSKSAAKQFLKKCFREQVISIDYKDAKSVWEQHCKDCHEFKRLKYDDAFVRRLGAVRDDYVKKVERCQKDLEAYKIAKANHPTPEFNSRGEPQWSGSDAQQLLKKMIADGGHVKIEPKVLWRQREEYQLYSLQTFRDHIYQEERLLKLQNYLSLLRKKRVDALQY